MQQQPGIAPQQLMNLRFLLGNLTGLQNVAQPRCAIQQGMLRYPPGYQSTQGMTPQNLTLLPPPQMSLSITDISETQDTDVVKCPDVEGNAGGNMTIDDNLLEPSCTSEGAANKAVETAGDPHGQLQNIQSNGQQQQDFRDLQQQQNQTNTDQLHYPKQQNKGHFHQNQQQQLRQQNHQKVDQNEQQPQHLPQVFVFGQRGQGTMPTVGFGFDKKLNEGSQSKESTDIPPSEPGEEPPLPLQNMNNDETGDGSENRNGACSDDTDSPKTYAQATSSGKTGKGSSNQSQQQGKYESISKLPYWLVCMKGWLRGHCTQTKIKHVLCTISKSSTLF